MLERFTLGGYVDLEYRGGDLGSTFRFHRLVPFLYGQISENIRFNAEIEIEDGEDLSVEFATVDYLFGSAINFRAGIILSPLGRLNLYHDSPIQEFTDRPLVDRTVIPTTFREAGFGFFGRLWQDEEIAEVNYEAYLTTGFKGLDAGGTSFIDTNKGIRNARASTSNGAKAYQDINDELAFVSRVSVRQPGEFEFGASVHTGSYDENANNTMTIMALDGRVEIGHLVVLGEWAYVNISRDAFAMASGVPGDMWGYYAELNYKIFPNFLDDLEGHGYVSEGSRFTLLARVGETDLDGAKKYRTTVGFNFRPNQVKTVFKFEYQWNSEGGSQASLDNNGFVASMATYF